MSVPATDRIRRGFDAVETWVFDLDNTLYPHDLNLWQQIDDRIRGFVSEFLGVTKDDAFRVQKDYYKRYGTTMIAPQVRLRTSGFKGTLGLRLIKSTKRVRRQDRWKRGNFAPTCHSGLQCA